MARVGGTVQVDTDDGVEDADVPVPSGRRAPAADRITAGALRCVARWGVAKTTLDDIAREAGCSRATIYRLFPGGKRAVLLASADAEVHRVLGELAERLEGAESLEQLMVVAIVSSVEAIRSHDALQYLICHEPGEVLAHVAFGALDPLLALATAFGQPYLERHLDAEAAAATAEWVTRLIVAYALEPDDIDLRDPQVAARIVETFVLPGLADHRVAGTAA
jgi:AcrR family transcriptional regulator